jgi:hypothetical protein
MAVFFFFFFCYYFVEYAFCASSLHSSSSIFIIHRFGPLLVSQRSCISTHTSLVFFSLSPSACSNTSTLSSRPDCFQCDLIYWREFQLWFLFNFLRISVWFFFFIEFFFDVLHCLISFNLCEFSENLFSHFVVSSVISLTILIII